MKFVCPWERAIIVDQLRAALPSHRVDSHSRRLLRLKARPATATVTASKPAAYILFTPSPPVAGKITPGWFLTSPTAKVKTEES